MSVLSLQNLKVSYQKQAVINALDLEIEAGEIVALFGPSGGGKSTVLKSIAGLLDEVEGHIEVNGVTLLSDKVRLPAEKRNTGLIFQDYALFPHMTVAENVGYGLHKLKKSQRAERIESMLALIKMTEYADKYPHELSGGQQQRIAIVRALACEPSIMLFDEAFSNIDPQLRFELIADIRALLKHQNTSALFVTHNQDEAFAFCDRIAVLNQGRIEQIGTSEQLFNYPSTKFVAEFLSDGLWLNAEITCPNRLSSELGELPYTGAESLAQRVGEQVHVFLRPHHLRLELAPDADSKVEHERFVGEFYESFVAWQGQQVKVKTFYSFLNKHVHIKVDTNVKVVFDAA